IQQDSLELNNDFVFAKHVSGTIRNNGSQVVNNLVLFNEQSRVVCDFTSDYNANYSVFLDDLNIAPGETVSFAASLGESRPVEVIDAAGPEWFCLNYPNFTTDANPNNNCVQLLLSDVEEATAVEELSVFPNPTATDWTIQQLPPGSYQWKLYDLSGRSLNAGQWSLGNEHPRVAGSVPPGVYLLEINGQAGRWVELLVKQ
ncbi:MAG: T9SS type A sorting domain-containing protein, partial [Bacteroidota bacterium]